MYNRRICRCLNTANSGVDDYAYVANAPLAFILSNLQLELLLNESYVCINAKWQYGRV